MNGDGGSLLSPVLDSARSGTQSETRLLVCPFSGGVESAVAAVHCASDSRNRVVLATMLYNQESEQQERDRTRRLAQLLRERYDTIVEHAILSLGDAFVERQGQGLIWRGAAAWSPELEAWCPRSALFQDEWIVGSRLDAFALLAMAGARARMQSDQAAGVVLGINREDRLRLPQLEQAPLRQRLAHLAARLEVGEVALEMPFIDMDKSEIIGLGLRLDVPLELTWSCYYGGDRPCDACEQCSSRTRAFASLGLVDPLRKLQSRRA